MHPHDSTLPGRIECICQHCGKSFVTFRSNVLRGNGRFCSFDCGVAHREIPLEDRFWREVQKSDHCWTWTGWLTPMGYGKISAKTNGKWRPILAHRLSYELAYGTIPDNLFVCHHCDNPTCVRPDHLFLGTNKDNIQDMVAKGRQQRGAKVTASKMTEAQVTEIRQRYAAEGITKTALAREYGIGKPAIGDILNRVTWKHIP
jgi:hypothetical protein